MSNQVKNDILNARDFQSEIGRIRSGPVQVDTVAADRVKQCAACLADPSTTCPMVDKNALVIFDVHEVLIISSDQILQTPYKKRVKDALAQAALLTSKEEGKALSTIVKIQHSVTLANPDIVRVLNALKGKQISILALTNATTGRLENGKLSEDVLLARLRSLEIDFSSSFPSLKSFPIEAAPGHSEGALFKDGVIFTNHRPKGVVLREFIRKLGISPSEISFVDNDAINRESVEECGKEMGIPVRVYESICPGTAALTPLNEERAKLQLRVLLTEKRWISDDEANAMLASRAFLRTLCYFPQATAIMSFAKNFVKKIIELFAIKIS